MSIAAAHASRSATTTVVAVLLLLFSASSAFMLSYNALAYWFLASWQVGAMVWVTVMAILWWAIAFSSYRLLQRRNWARQFLAIGLWIVLVVSVVQLVLSARRTLLAGATPAEGINTVASAIDIVLIGIALAAISSRKTEAECDGSRLRDFFELRETENPTPLEKSVVASMRSAAAQASEVGSALRREVGPERRPTPVAVRLPTVPPRRAATPPPMPRARVVRTKNLVARRWVVRVILIGLLAASLYFMRSLPDQWPYYALLPLLYGILLTLTIGLTPSRIGMVLGIVAAAVGFVLLLDVLPLITDFAWISRAEGNAPFGVALLLTTLVLGPQALLMIAAALHLTATSRSGMAARS